MPWFRVSLSRRSLLALPARATLPTRVPDDIKQRVNRLVNEAILSPAINIRLVQEFALHPRNLDLAASADCCLVECESGAKYVKIAKIEP